jgi:hypothetical protein
MRCFEGDVLHVLQGPPTAVRNYEQLLGGEIVLEGVA